MDRRQFFSSHETLSLYVPVFITGLLEHSYVFLYVEKLEILFRFVGVIAYALNNVAHLFVMHFLLLVTYIL